MDATALPPGPRAPRAWQTTEWIVRPTAFLRRCARVYGEPFTLRTHWEDGPTVLLWNPEDVRRVFSAGPETMGAVGDGSILEPFAGPHSILVLDGDAHLQQRRRMLPAFHGERMRRRRALIADLARAELRRWPRDTPIATHERMQALTLEVMLRVVFGSTDPQLRDAIARALALTRSAPRLVAMSLGLSAAFAKAVERVDEQLYALIAKGPQDEDAILADLLATSSTEREVRDQLVTLLAAGHETTATALAWAFERLGRRPDVVARLPDDAFRAAVAKEILRIRPVLSIAPRRLKAPFTVAGHTLPAGVNVAPCLYLAHLREATWGDPYAFRPERFLTGEVPGSAWIPFGGGTRRCLGAPFALLELEAVLDEAARAGRLAAPGRPERVRRRSVTLAPARGGRVRITAP